MSDASNTNSVLFLGPSDVKDVITMSDAIDLVDTGYADAAKYPIINAPRRRVHSPEGVRVSNFPGGIDSLGVIGSLTRAESVDAALEQIDHLLSFPNPGASPALFRIDPRLGSLRDDPRFQRILQDRSN